MDRVTPVCSPRDHQRRHARSRSALLFATLVVLGACGNNTGSSNRAAPSETTGATQPPTDTVSVAVAFYPIEEIVGRVGGDRIEMVRLVEPGDNAHDAELTAKTVESLGNADMVFYMSGGFQPAVEKAVDVLPSSVRVIDLFETEGITHIGADETTSGETADEGARHDHNHDQNHDGDDPHIWLDPANMSTMARAVAEVLANVDPAGAEIYNANADIYASEMADLGDTLESRFARCATRTLVTAHDAFGYFARRAGLETVAVAGLNPEDEPSARQLESIATAAENAGVATVFFEVSLPEDLARTIADTIGAGVDTLDALEGVTKETIAAGGTYSSIMRGNIDRIASALGCS